MSLNCFGEVTEQLHRNMQKKVVNGMANYQILHNCILHLAQILYSSFSASVVPQPPHVAVGDPLKLKCGFQGEQ